MVLLAALLRQPGGQAAAAAVFRPQAYGEKGDGKHIDHKDGNPKNNSKKNLRVVKAKNNRVKQ